MSQTRTGHFGIGFRRGGGWQDDLDALAAWAKANGFECLDVRGADACRKVVAAGLAVGSADLADWQGMISPDKAARKDAVAKNAQLIRDCKGVASNFFVVMLPAKQDLPREENFDYMVDSFSQLTGVLAKCGSRVVIEGWPGPAALCCTPETIRAFFKEVDSPTMGLNFDPSHLIRMGIDHTRFIDEFADRVGHVHGKDTEILTDNLSEVGLYQQSIFKQPVFCGEFAWRYTIPGHGVTRWSYVLGALQKAGFTGAVSVELEDADYNGTEEGEKAGLLASLNCLRTV